MEERLKLRWSAHAGVGVFGATLIDEWAPELMVGAGLRKGISRLWDSQARASLSIVLARFTVLIPNVDATFRVHFGEASPWFDWRQLFLQVRDNYFCRSRPWFEGLPRRPRGGSSGWGSWWVA